MKHYISYDAQGRLVGVHTIHHAGTQLGGWPDDIRLDDENCTHEAAKSIRANIIGKNGAVGFVAYNCSCPATKTTCSCANKKYAKSKFAGGQLVTKLEAAVMLDGGPLANDAIVNRVPSSSTAFRVACANVPNGAKVTVFQRGHVALMEASKIELTFTDGQTEEFSLVAPAQGLTGAVAITGDDVLPMGLFLRGWASA